MSNNLNGRLQTPVGAPSSMRFELPSSMVNATKTEVRIQPYGNATFDQPGQVIRLVIPKTDRAFINPETMYITGNIALTPGSPAVVGSDPFYFIGSYYSMFSRQVITQNGITLDTIERPGELTNTILNMTLNPAEKKGLANTMGFYVDAPSTEGDATSNFTAPMNYSATATEVLAGGSGLNVTFAIPLIGVLNCAKELPIFNGDFTIELTLNTPSNYMQSTSTNGLASIAANSNKVTLTNIELSVDQLTLTPESFSMVMAPYMDSNGALTGKLHIKSQSYDFGSAPIPLGGGGVDIPVGIKRSSLKEIITYFNDPTGIDKSFGGVNPNGTDLIFQTNGLQYPQRPLKLSNPSECFNQVQKAFGSLYSNNHSGSMGKAEFCRRMSGNNEYVVMATTVSTMCPVYGNKFYLAIDTELLNYNTESLYSGIAMGVNSNFRLNYGTIPRACTQYFWMCYDAVIEMDLANGITSVIA